MTSSESGKNSGKDSAADGKSEDELEGLIPKEAKWYLDQKVILEAKKKYEETKRDYEESQQTTLKTKLQNQQEIETLKQSIRASQRSNYVVLPDSTLSFQAGSAPASAAHVAPGQMYSTAWLNSGGVAFDGDHMVVVDSLADDDKGKLFQGASKVLYGRTLNLNNNKILSCSKRLFKLKKDIEIDEAVIPWNQKNLEILESYNALQANLTRNSYFDSTVQANVALFSGASASYRHFKEVTDIHSETNIHLTAQSLIKKGELIIDQDTVEYTDKFKSAVKELLSQLKQHYMQNDLKVDAKENKKIWKEFFDKYGQYYISRCIIGGAAFSSQDKIVSNNSEREVVKHEFRAAFEGTVKSNQLLASESTNGHAGFKKGKDKDNFKETIDQKTTTSLDCHGGNVSACTPNDFSVWENSVNRNYRLWDVVEVLEVKPFYHLIKDKKTKAELIKYMPNIQLPVKHQKYDHNQTVIISLKNKKTGLYWTATQAAHVSRKHLFGKLMNNIESSAREHISCSAATVSTKEKFYSVPAQSSNRIYLKAYDDGIVGFDETLPIPFQDDKKYHAMCVYDPKTRPSKKEEYTLIKYVEESKNEDEPAKDNVYALQCYDGKYVSVNGKSKDLDMVCGSASNEKHGNGLALWIIEVQDT